VKANDKYRFTLQWGTETSEKIQAGDFLESLGNRKSEVIVIAVTEYLKAHPGILKDGRKPQVIVKPNITDSRLRDIVKAMIEEKLAELTVMGKEAEDHEEEAVVSDIDVDEMLKNLDLFS
jgi:hypothetical protein